MSSFQASMKTLVSPLFRDKLSTIKALLQQRRDRLIFVADYDHTLTTMQSHQCHDSICYNPYLTESFRDACFKIMEMPMSDWNQWWIIFHDHLVREGNLTAQLFRDGLNTLNFQFRDHCHDVFHLLHTENIPSFIVSAGIQNLIEEMMQKHAMATGDHLQFFTNRMVFDDQDRLQTFEPAFPVSSQSKHLLTSHLPDIFQQIIETNDVVSDSNRHSNGSRIDNNTSTNDGNNNGSITPKYDVAVVLGDNVWDFSVLKEVPYFQTINIGFAYDHDKALLLQKKGRCDLVFIGEDHDMRPVHDLLSELLAVPTNSGSTNATTSST